MSAIVLWTAEQSIGLRNVEFCRCTLYERNGVPCRADGTKVTMLSFSECLQEIYKKILELGFTKIERVAPIQANCIIRVFEKRHFAYGYDDVVFNICGARCYTRLYGQWVTDIGMPHRLVLNYGYFAIRHWFYQDEYVDIDLDFVDVPVRIK